MCNRNVLPNLNSPHSTTQQAIHNQYPCPILQVLWSPVRLRRRFPNALFFKQPSTHYSRQTPCCQPRRQPRPFHLVKESYIAKRALHNDAARIEQHHFRGLLGRRHRRKTRTRARCIIVLPLCRLRRREQRSGRRLRIHAHSENWPINPPTITVPWLEKRRRSGISRQI